MKIGLIGMGKLGLPMGVAFSSRGHDIVGVDLDEKRVEKIENGEPPHLETNLGQFLRRYPIRATTDYRKLSDREIIFMMLPTPSQEDGSFSNKSINKSLDELIAREIHPDVLAISSTVMPGSCREFQKKVGDKTKVVYNPEFVAIGSVIKNILHPDFVLIGSEDKDAGNKVEGIYKDLLSYNDASFLIPETVMDSTIYRTNLVNAELSKITLNSFITMKINFANILGELCEYVEGGDVDEVTNAIGLDRRIGKHFLRSGMAYGGTCFPRDNRAFGYILDTNMMNDTLPEVIDVNNKHQTERIVDKISDILGRRGDSQLHMIKIAILGTAYKPDTFVTEESPSLWLDSALYAQGAVVRTYDETGHHGPYTISQALEGTDLAVLTLDTKEQREVSAETFIEYMKHPRVLDCWRIRPDLRDNPKIEYHALGVYEK